MKKSRPFSLKPASLQRERERESYAYLQYKESGFINAYSNNEFCFEYNQNKPIKISTYNPPAADGGICYAFDSNTRVCCCEC